MNKFVFLLAGMLCFSGILSGNDENEKKNKTSEISIKGVVIDEDSGELLTGVLIKILEKDIKVYTDFNGEFNIHGVNKDDYTLLASYISYKEKEQKMRINENKKEGIKIFLTPLN